MTATQKYKVGTEPKTPAPPAPPTIELIRQKRRPAAPGSPDEHDLATTYIPCITVRPKDQDESTRAAIKEIVSLFGHICAAAKMSLDRAIRMGELLSELKEKKGHGRWLKFVKQELPFSERKAQQYIRLFENRDELKSATVADLQITEALQALTKSKPEGASSSSEQQLGIREQKARLITSVTRLLLERIERLDLKLIEQFKTDVATFKEEWLRTHAPDLAESTTAGMKGAKQ